MRFKKHLWTRKQDFRVAANKKQFTTYQMELNLSVMVDFRLSVSKFGAQDVLLFLRTKNFPGLVFSCAEI